MISSQNIVQKDMNKFQVSKKSRESEGAREWEYFFGKYLTPLCTYLSGYISQLRL